MRQNLNFNSLVRQNTGTHFLDSGGDNGRHWQSKPVKKSAWLSFSNYRDNEFEVSATISTAAFLDNQSAASV